MLTRPKAADSSRENGDAQRGVSTPMENLLVDWRAALAKR
jgi:hypothetical protein